MYWLLGGDAIPDLRTVGVGHSMGAVLTVRQQAVYGGHQALALLGFSTRGLPQYLPPEVLACADGQRDDVRLNDARLNDARLAELALRMFGSAYTVLSSVAGADSPTRRAIEAAAAVTLTAGGLLSMLPGNVSAELARLTVPVLILNGERDPLICGPEDVAHSPAGSVSRVSTREPCS